MFKKIWLVFLCFVFLIGIYAENSEIKLPEPKKNGDLSIERALENRRAIRRYSSKPLSLKEVSQLLWAAQGITNKRGYRTAPSAGALYPLKLYIIAKNVESLKKGTYKYLPQGHKLIKIKSNTNIEEVYKGALSQWS